MKIENGKITEATEAELMERYLRYGHDEEMSFMAYLAHCRRIGVNVVGGEDNA